MKLSAMIDKSKWGPGPWQEEPDRVEFKHEGFPCLITRTPMGHLCGYVAVPPGHPWHGKGYDDEPLYEVDVHGGLTYAAACAGDVCHVPALGEPDDVWWLGFDHAHSGDRSPGTYFQAHINDLYGFGTYKTVEYVRAGVESLAQQAKAAER